MIMFELWIDVFFVSSIFIIIGLIFSIYQFFDNLIAYKKSPDNSLYKTKYLEALSYLLYLSIVLIGLVIIVSGVMGFSVYMVYTLFTVLVGGPLVITLYNYGGANRKYSVLLRGAIILIWSLVFCGSLMLTLPSVYMGKEGVNPYSCCKGFRLYIVEDVRIYHIEHGSPKGRFDISWEELDEILTILERPDIRTKYNHGPLGTRLDVQRIKEEIIRDHKNNADCPYYLLDGKIMCDEHNDQFIEKGGNRENGVRTR